MIKKVILGIVVMIGALALLLVILLVGYGFYSVRSNEAAEQAARKLCSGARTGTNIDTVIKTAARGSEKYRLNHFENEYRFTFSGAIFFAVECKVTTENDKVASTEITVYDD
ncbi:MAG: hypothetical protein ACREO1_04915 [Arenimonas sp.]